MQARVQACYLYPVKACGALEVEALRFDAAGQIEGDREWLVVDAEGSVTWQGAFPRLAQVLPVQVDGRLGLRNTAGELFMLPEPGAACTVNWWNDGAKRVETLKARDGGDAAAAFISAAAGASLRLVHTAEMRHRPNAVHVCALPSWQELSEEAGGGDASSWLRMRPNLLLAPEGEDEDLLPFIEEQVTVFTGAHASLLATERCVRCIVPNVAPASGAVDERWLAAATRLSAQRFPGSPVAFGVYAQAQGAGEVRRGESLALELSFG